MIDMMPESNRRSYMKTVMYEDQLITAKGF
jgi:hypothetical protein